MNVFRRYEKVMESKQMQQELEEYIEELSDEARLELQERKLEAELKQRKEL